MGVVIPFKPLPRRRELKQPPPPSAATLPNAPAARPKNASIIFRAVDGWPIHVRARDGVMHACESFELHPGVFITTTICEQDAEAGREYISDNLDEVTCPICAERRWIPLYNIGVA
jgi:hypothetical protein